jgi:hypothetical protein
MQTFICDDTVGFFCVFFHELTDKSVLCTVGQTIIGINKYPTQCYRLSESLQHLYWKFPPKSDILAKMSPMNRPTNKGVFLTLVSKMFNTKAIDKVNPYNPCVGSFLPKTISSPEMPSNLTNPKELELFFPKEAY